MSVVRIEEEIQPLKYLVITQEVDPETLVTTNVVISDNRLNKINLLSIERGPQGNSGPTGPKGEAGKDGLIFDKLPVSSGGTNNTTFSSGNIIYYDGNKLSSSTYSIQNILDATGSNASVTGVINGSGLYRTSSDKTVTLGINTGEGLFINGSNQIAVDDTIVRRVELDLGGIQGMVPISKGGTNNSTFTGNRLLYYDGLQISSFPLNTGTILLSGTKIDIVAGSGLTGGGDLTLPNGSVVLNINGSEDILVTSDMISLSTTGVPGTYSKVTTDSKGRVVSGGSLSSADILAILGYTPWHPDNDGSGSGLDADLLDGFSSSIFLDLSTHTGIIGNTNLPIQAVPGTYTKVQVNDRGIVINGQDNTYNDIVQALGYRPVSTSGDTIYGPITINGDVNLNSDNLTVKDNIPVFGTNSASILPSEPRGFGFIYGGATQRTGILAYYPAQQELRLVTNITADPASVDGGGAGSAFGDDIDGGNQNAVFLMDNLNGDPNIVLFRGIADNIYISRLNPQVVSGVKRFADGITVNGQISIIPNVGQTDPPLNVGPNANMVVNLNSDLLDGQHGSYYTNAFNMTGLFDYQKVEFNSLEGDLGYIPRFDERTSNPSRTISNSYVRQTGNVIQITSDANIAIGSTNTGLNNANRSLAVGLNNKIYSDNGLAVGNNNVVSGNNSVALNVGSKTLKPTSIAAGNYGYTWANNQFSFGAFSEIDSTNNASAQGQFSTIALYLNGTETNGSYYTMSPAISIPKNKTLAYSLEVLLNKAAGTGAALFSFSSGIIKNSTFRDPSNITSILNVTSVLKNNTKQEIYNDSQQRTHYFHYKLDDDLQIQNLKVSNPPLQHLPILAQNTESLYKYTPEYLSLVGVYTKTNSGNVLLNLPKPLSNGWFYQNSGNPNLFIRSYNHAVVTGCSVNLNVLTGSIRKPLSKPYKVVSIIDKHNFTVAEHSWKGYFISNNVFVLDPKEVEETDRISPPKIFGEIYTGGNTLTYTKTNPIGSVYSGMLISFGPDPATYPDSLAQTGKVIGVTSDSITFTPNFTGVYDGFSIYGPGFCNVTNYSRYIFDNSPTIQFNLGSYGYESVTNLGGSIDTTYCGLRTILLIVDGLDANFSGQQATVSPASTNSGTLTLVPRRNYTARYDRFQTVFNRYEAIYTQYTSFNGSSVISLFDKNLEAIDLPSTPFSYSLVCGEQGSENNSSFSIVNDHLVSAQSFDYENKSSYKIRVRSTDMSGRILEKSFTINILDVLDTTTTTTTTTAAPNPITNINDYIILSNQNIQENLPSGTVIGKLSTLGGYSPYLEFSTASNSFSGVLVSGSNVISECNPLYKTYSNTNPSRNASVYGTPYTLISGLTIHTSHTGLLSANISGIAEPIAINGLTEYSGYIISGCSPSPVNSIFSGMKLYSSLSGWNPESRVESLTSNSITLNLPFTGTQTSPVSISVSSIGRSFILDVPFTKSGIVNTLVTYSGVIPNSGSYYPSGLQSFSVTEKSGYCPADVTKSYIYGFSTQNNQYLSSPGYYLTGVVYFYSNTGTSKISVSLPENLYLEADESSSYLNFINSNVGSIPLDDSYRDIADLSDTGFSVQNSHWYPDIAPNSTGTVLLNIDRNHGFKILDPLILNQIPVQFVTAPFNNTNRIPKNNLFDILGINGNKITIRDSQNYLLTETSKPKYFEKSIEGKYRIANTFNFSGTVFHNYNRIFNIDKADITSFLKQNSIIGTNSSFSFSYGSTHILPISITKTDEPFSFGAKIIPGSNIVKYCGESLWQTRIFSGVNLYSTNSLINSNGSTIVDHIINPTLRSLALDKVTFQAPQLSYDFSASSTPNTGTDYTKNYVVSGCNDGFLSLSGHCYFYTVSGVGPYPKIFNFGPSISGFTETNGYVISGCSPSPISSLSVGMKLYSTTPGWNPDSIIQSLTSNSITLDLPFTGTQTSPIPIVVTDVNRIAYETLSMNPSQATIKRISPSSSTNTAFNTTSLLPTSVTSIHSGSFLNSSPPYPFSTENTKPYASGMKIPVSININVDYQDVLEIKATSGSVSHVVPSLNSSNQIIYTTGTYSIYSFFDLKNIQTADIVPDKSIILENNTPSLGGGSSNISIPSSSTGGYIITYPDNSGDERRNGIEFIIGETIVIEISPIITRYNISGTYTISNIVQIDGFKVAYLTSSSSTAFINWPPVGGGIAFNSPFSIMTGQTSGATVRGVVLTNVAGTSSATTTTAAPNITTIDTETSLVVSVKPKLFLNNKICITNGYNGLKKTNSYFYNGDSIYIDSLSLPRSYLNPDDQLTILSYNGNSSFGSGVSKNIRITRSNSRDTAFSGVPVNGNNSVILNKYAPTWYNQYRFTDPLGLTLDQPIQPTGFISFIGSVSGNCNIPFNNNIYYHSHGGFTASWPKDPSGVNVPSPQTGLYTIGVNSQNCSSGTLCVRVSVYNDSRFRNIPDIVDRQSVGKQSNTATTSNGSGYVRPWGVNKKFYFDFSDDAPEINGSYYITDSLDSNTFTLNIPFDLDYLSRSGLVYIIDSDYDIKSNRNPNINNVFETSQGNISLGTNLVDYYINSYNDKSHRWKHLIHFNNTINNFGGYSGTIHYGQAATQLISLPPDLLKISQIEYLFNDELTYRTITDNTLTIPSNKNQISLKLTVSNGAGKWSDNLYRSAPRVNIYGFGSYNIDFANIVYSNSTRQWTIPVVVSDITQYVTNKTITITVNDESGTDSANISLTTKVLPQIPYAGTNYTYKNSAINWVLPFDIKNLSTDSQSYTLSANGYPGSSYNIVNEELLNASGTKVLIGSAGSITGVFNPVLTVRDYVTSEILASQSGQIVVLDNNQLKPTYSINPQGLDNDIYIDITNINDIASFSFFLPAILDSQSSPTVNFTTNTPTLSISSTIEYSNASQRYRVNASISGSAGYYPSINANIAISQPVVALDDSISWVRYTKNQTLNLTLYKKIIINKSELIEPLVYDPEEPWALQFKIQNGIGSHRSDLPPKVKLSNLPTIGTYSSQPLEYILFTQYDETNRRWSVSVDGKKNIFDKETEALGYKDIQIYAEDGVSSHTNTIRLFFTKEQYLDNIRSIIHATPNNAYQSNVDIKQALPPPADLPQVLIAPSPLKENTIQLTRPYAKYDKDLSVWEYAYSGSPITDKWDVSVDITNQNTSLGDNSYSQILVKCKGIATDKIYGVGKLNLVELDSSYLSSIGGTTVPFQIVDVEDPYRAREGFSWEVSFATIGGLENPNYPPTILLSGLPSSCSGYNPKISVEDQAACFISRSWNPTNKKWSFSFSGLPLCNISGAKPIIITAIDTDTTQNLYLSSDKKQAIIEYKTLIDQGLTHPGPTIKTMPGSVDTIPMSPLCGEAPINNTYQFHSNTRLQCPEPTGISGWSVSGSLPSGLNYTISFPGGNPSSPWSNLGTGTLRIYGEPLTFANGGSYPDVFTLKVFDARGKSATKEIKFTDTSTANPPSPINLTVYFDGIDPAYTDRGDNIGSVQQPSGTKSLDGNAQQNYWPPAISDALTCTSILPHSECQTSLFRYSGGDFVAGNTNVYIDNITNTKLTNTVGSLIYAEFSNNSPTNIFNGTYIVKQSGNPSIKYVTIPQYEARFITGSGRFVQSAVKSINTSNLNNFKGTVDTTTNKSILGCGIIKLKSIQDPTNYGLFGRMRPSFAASIPVSGSFNNNDIFFTGLNISTISEYSSFPSVYTMKTSNCWETGYIRISGISVPRPSIELFAPPPAQGGDAVPFSYNNQAYALLSKCAYGNSQYEKDLTENYRSVSINYFIKHCVSGTILNNGSVSTSPAGAAGGSPIQFNYIFNSGAVLSLFIEKPSDKFPTYKYNAIPYAENEYFWIHKGGNRDDNPTQASFPPIIITGIKNNISCMSGQPISGYSVRAIGGYVPFSGGSQKIPFYQLPNNTVWNLIDYAPSFTGVLQKKLNEKILTGTYQHSGFFGGTTNQKLNISLPANATSVFKPSDSVLVNFSGNDISFNTGLILNDSYGSTMTLPYQYNGISTNGTVTVYDKCYVQSVDQSAGTTSLLLHHNGIPYQTGDYVDITDGVSISTENNIILSNYRMSIVSGDNSFVRVSFNGPDTFAFGPLNSIDFYDIKQNYYDQIKLSNITFNKEGEWRFGLSGTPTGLYKDYKYKIFSLENSGLPAFSGTSLTPKKYMAEYPVYINKPLKIILPQSVITNGITNTNGSWSLTFEIEGGTRPVYENTPEIWVNNSICNFSRNLNTAKMNDNYNSSTDRLSINLSSTNNVNYDWRSIQILNIRVYDNTGSDTVTVNLNQA